MMTPSETEETDDEETPQIDITKKPGRAFLHKLTGKFLAESGIKSFRWMEQYGIASALSWRNFKTQEFISNQPRKQSFSKTLFKPGKLENTALRQFSCEWKAELFENDEITISCDFPDRVVLNHKSKVTDDACVFKFLRRSVDGKHLMRFQIKISVFEFLQRSVLGAWDDLYAS